MLIKFSLRNYKVFRDKVELSLIASNYDKDTNEENVFEVPKYDLRLLKSAVVYGANASGKSKLIEALSFMRYFVRSSSKDKQKGEEIPIAPFRLSTLSENEPSEFEVTFIYKDVLYRYGFEATPCEIVSEWLYYRPNTKEVEVFYRSKQEFELHKRGLSSIVNQLVKGENIRENALLISVAAQFNDKIASAVLDWFTELRTISGLREEGYKGFTISMVEKSAVKIHILKMLQLADLGISDITAKAFDPNNLSNDLPDEVKEFIQKRVSDDKADFLNDVQTSHPKYDEFNRIIDQVLFSMDEDESSGTKKFFALTGPLLDVLADGATFFVDELDAKMHPNLVCAIVHFFHSPRTNPKNAQLIFNTHDTNLLGVNSFRRDQIWFTEKDRYGAATLYSLADYKPRKGENFEHNYIRGKYGAIPYLSDFSRLFDNSENLIHAGTEE